MKPPKFTPALSPAAPQPLLENPLSGYPIYPVDEDIYNQFKEEKEINPENVTVSKPVNTSGIDSGLDIPGSELDDQQEAIGSEDEENNYYSIGGDAHDNLEEHSGN
ncbi:MAG: hypothetical protein ACOYOT_12425 [Bacteroidales bacterium]